MLAGTDDRFQGRRSNAEEEKISAFVAFCAIAFLRKFYLVFIAPPGKKGCFLYVVL